VASVEDLIKRRCGQAKKPKRCCWDTKKEYTAETSGMLAVEDGMKWTTAPSRVLHTVTTRPSPSASLSPFRRTYHKYQVFSHMSSQLLLNMTPLRTMPTPRGLRFSGCSSTVTTSTATETVTCSITTSNFHQHTRIHGRTPCHRREHTNILPNRPRRTSR
jgi:hypothetical protein